jgi:N-methylhydantoinase B
MRLSGNQHRCECMTGQSEFDAIELGVFSSRLEAVCDEMGAVLRRAAFSPNIKDRLDYSCAIFDQTGELCAQAAHIPVHLGSMAYAMAGIVDCLRWCPGDMVVLNDPFLGGTHLPDVTLIAPFFVAGQLRGFVANRAHHANIGADAPGSMPLSTHIEQEGVLLSPVHLIRGGDYQGEVVRRLAQIEDTGDGELGGDFQAQVGANRVGVLRVETLIAGMGDDAFCIALDALNRYAERLARSEYELIPDGVWCFRDVMDDDGAGTEDVIIAVAICVAGSDICVDFKGTAAQVPGNINCPLAVAAAAVYYVFRCLLPAYAPGCAGLFRAITLRAESGSLVNAEHPAAVAAGNVETSSRIVDVVLGALAAAIPLRIPAASHGSMNNIAMGARGPSGWNYYETVGGGMGASALGDGLSGVQTHMTNTYNTPIESLEAHYPLRVLRYQLRPGSGGAGSHRGGDGLVRELEFLAPAELSLLSERRRHRPWGLGGEGGQTGENRLNGDLLPAKCMLSVQAGDRLSVATPGGGGWVSGESGLKTK